MKVLHLVLKKKWFDMVASGEKKEEYREIKDYWGKRLFGNQYDVVIFHHGYSKDRESITLEIKSIHIGIGKTIWGAKHNKYSIIIELGKIIE